MSNIVQMRPRKDPDRYSSLCENCGRTAQEDDMDQPRYVDGFGAYLCGDCEDDLATP